MEHWLRIASGTGEVAFDAEVGNIRRFAVAGREVLHTAHWVGTPAADQAESVIDTHLAGDFFAAPFGTSDLVPDPPHGWSANSRWSVQTRGARHLKLALDRTVMGARISKDLRLSEMGDVLYQTHEITGGEGVLPVAHHPMLRLSPGDPIAFSPKRMALTSDTPLEDRHILAYPAQSIDLTEFPAHDGGIVDLTRYPRQSGHEDFVSLIEAEGASFGWSAVTRAEEGDVVVILKDARVMPVTMLWLSNGGRDYAPWNGRHEGVLGLEDGVTAGAEGHRAASEGRSQLASAGVATGLHLGVGVTHVTRHAMAVFPGQRKFGKVKQVILEGSNLSISGSNGDCLETAFDPCFFSI